MSKPAANSFIRMFKFYFLAGRDGLWVSRKRRPAIFLITVFVLFTAHGPFFAVADRIDARCRQPLRQQEFFDGVRAAVAKAEVVFLAAALVTVAFDGEPHTRVLLKPRRIALEFGNLTRPDIGLIVIEVDLLHVFTEEFVTGLVNSGRWRSYRRRRRGRR